MLNWICQDQKQSFKGGESKMVLGTVTGLIELTPTITSAQLVSDLVTGRSSRRAKRKLRKKLRKIKRRRR